MLGLKLLVGFLGVLIVIGTALVIGVVIHRIYDVAAAPSMPVPVPAGAAGPVTLAAGERVAGIAAAGSDVAVWVTGPDGDRVLLVDPRTGGATVVVAK